MKVIEKTTLESLRDTFEGENIQARYKVLEYEIDLYFHDYKLTLEIDEKDNQDRDIICERERQKPLQKELGCKFIRINPDKENFKFLRLTMKYLGTLKNEIKNQLKN